MSDQPASPRTPLWEDFIDIYIAPAAVFARRRTASFAIPLVLVTALLVVLTIGVLPLLQPVLDAEYERQTAVALERSPQLTADQLERARELSTRFLPVVMAFMVPLGVVVTAFILWLASRLVEARQQFATALLVATYAQFPRVLEQIVYGAQGALLDMHRYTARVELSVGPARFLHPDRDSPLLIALAARLDLFTLWVVTLLAIGVAVTGGVSRARAAIVGVLVWLLGTLPAVWGAFGQ